jgi:hypothetical protein
MQMDADGFRWIQMDSDRFRWIQMDSDGFRWIQICEAYIYIYILYIYKAI